MLVRPLVLCLLLSTLLIQQSSSELIDDFTSISSKVNTFGSPRYTSHIQHSLDPPMITMLGPKSTLTEGLTLQNGHRDLTGKAFKIKYYTATKTMMKLKLIQFGFKSFFDSNKSGIEVDFMPNTDFVLVPSDLFIDTDFAFVKALQLIGPITSQISIKSLELVNTAEPLVETYTRHLVDDFSMHSILVNALNLGMHSNNLSYTPFGLILHTVNRHVTEQLAPSDKCLDLTGKSIRLMYSSHAAGPRKLVLQAKRTVCNDEEIVNYPALVQLSKGINLEIIIPISTTFKNVDPAVCSQLIINGPIYLHRIELVDLAEVPPVSIASVFQYKVFAIRNALLKIHKSYPSTTIQINRSKVYESASSQIMALEPTRLRSRLAVVFENEVGVDEGGLSRELFTLLSAEIANPARKLFNVLQDANYALQVNPNNHNLGDYRFVGRIFGLSILHNLQLTIHFVPTLFKLVQGIDITLDDILLVDPIMHQSLQKMLREPDAHKIGMTMSVDHRTLNNQLVTLNLMPNGEHVPVTDDNKLEYVHLYCKWQIELQFQKQVNAIWLGLLEIIPRDHLMRLRPSELSKLISGSARIDLLEWQQYTTYDGYTKTDPVVQMFWDCVSEWTHDQRAKLLQFATGSPRFPPREFRNSEDNVVFVIKKGGDVSRYPSSHTCFKELVLPPYPNSSNLCSKLEYAVQEGGLFGIA